ncbi:MAG: hypothetical protein IKJ63_00325 [Clostridia bacterium]|nr:hypothetical protein [Clostridia bacterium]
MKNFLAILGCFFLAIIMIVVFASCGNRDIVTVEDPDTGSVVDEVNEEESTKKNNKNDTDADTTAADEADTEADNTDADAEDVQESYTGTGSSFLDTVLGGVEDVVGEALGGAADVVEEALAGAADKVNSALNEKED